MKIDGTTIDNSRYAGKILGKRSIGWLKNLREWIGTTNNHLFRSAKTALTGKVFIQGNRTALHYLQ